MTVKSVLHVSILRKVPSVVTRLLLKLLLMLLLRGVWVACKVSRCVLHWCGEFSFSIVLSISLPHYVLVLVLVLYCPLSMILPDWSIGGSGVGFNCHDRLSSIGRIRCCFCFCYRMDRWDRRRFLDFHLYFFLLIGLFSFIFFCIAFPRGVGNSAGARLVARDVYSELLTCR